MAASKTALIIGISGQDGSYLGESLVAKGYTVHGTWRDKDWRISPICARSASITGFACTRRPLPIFALSSR